MEKGEIFTPASEITGGARPKAVQKAPTSQRRVVAKDEDKAKRAGQVHFKAAHGLVVAFFTFILYVPLNAADAMALQRG
jgi:phosphatidylinositol glycan class O